MQIFIRELFILRYNSWWSTWIVLRLVVSIYYSWSKSC
jgi:hypothetical protein